MKIYYLSFFLGLLLLIGCQGSYKGLNQEELEGAWLIAGVEMDIDFYKPSSLILRFKKDSVYYESMKGDILKKSRLLFQKDTVVIDSFKYDKRKVKLKENQLDFIQFKAHRIVETKPLDTIKLREVLLKNDWKDSEGVFQFTTDNKFKLFNEVNESYKQYCYDFKSYHQAYFLIKKGNQLACNRDYQFAEQILSFTGDTLKVFRFENGKFTTHSYTAKPKERHIAKRETFQLCNKYINKNNRYDRYYYKGTRFKGGLYHIRKIVKEHYIAPEQSTATGIFQVRFVVNCEGKAGMFETQAFDYDYNLIDFDADISKQLLAIVKGLQDWTPGKNQQTQLPIDTYIYINFRIKDGKIIRISP